MMRRIILILIFCLLPTVTAFASHPLIIDDVGIIIGVKFGIQPLIASIPDGTPLYAPHPLSIAVPAMAMEQLALFAVIEGMLTAMIQKYFISNEPELAYSQLGTCNKSLHEA
jgi:cobalt/nickel transport system permease protein